MHETIKVLIVDDHPVVRHGLRTMLKVAEDIEILGEAGEASSALQLTANLAPDVVLLDIRMPGITGVEVTRKLKDRHPGIGVIVLTTFADEEYVAGAVEAGADAYLLKSLDSSELVDAIRSVHAGSRVMSPSLVPKLMSEFEHAAKWRRRAEFALEGEEYRILELIAEGATNKAIGAELHWSEVTVKKKVSEILRKLQVSNRAEAVAEAARRGLL